MQEITIQFPDNFLKNDVHNCPKCGSANVDMWICGDTYEKPHENPTHIFCWDCGARTARRYPTPKLAAIVWNANAPGQVLDSDEATLHVLKELNQDYPGDAYDEVIKAVEWEKQKRPLPLNGLETTQKVYQNI